MSRIIFFNIPASGHINPTIGVIRELVTRGEAVTCVNTEDTRPRYATTGATFIPYPDLDITEAALSAMSNNPSLMDNAVTLAEIGERIAPWCVQFLREQQPDFIVHDSLCSWVKQAADVLDMRSIGSFTTFALSFKSMKMPLGQMARTMFELVTRLPRYRRVMQRVKQGDIVAPVPFLTMFSASGDMNLVYTSADFQPEAASFGADYRFVGPVIESRPPMPNFPLEQIAQSQRPVIYISLGTVNNLNVDFYRTCFAAFRDYPALFVLSIGQQIDPGSAGTPPENFIMRGSVPQLDVLQHAALFITHGGMNSVHEGLWYGVPLIVVPQQAEQLIVGRRVESQGAGVVLEGIPGGPVNAPALRAAVDQIAAGGMNAKDNPYRVQAARIGETLRAAGGAKRAADEIQAFAKQNREGTPVLNVNTVR